MTPEQFRQVEALFHRGKDLPPAEQRALLDAECADDAEVRAEVEKLLAQADPAETLADLKGRVNRVLRPGGDDPSAAAASPAIEGYEILREIHRGGQGVVYQAIQKSTKRKVAIKVLLEGPYASKSARRRFEREIELVAQLKHPNIVSIFHSGQTSDGRQYCVMDYVRGVPLDQYVRNEKLTLEDALRLFAKVCEAVNYAHQKGVIHRDLKPSNILVTPPLHTSPLHTPPFTKGGSGGVGDPKVLDFGLAKQLISREASLISLTGQVVGTLPYMSPEQAEGNPDKIDIRTDVYALGVILYQMLTGHYPYPVAGKMAEVLKHIAETEPTPPTRSWKSTSGVTQRTHKRIRPGQCPIDDEVQTIVLRTLAKERDRRYQSAGELAKDVGHYLADEPIDAKRDSAFYVIRKQLRRYKLPVAVAAAFVLLLSGATVALSIMYQNQNRAREKAEQSHQAELKQRHIADVKTTEANAATKQADERAKLLRRSRYTNSIASAQFAYSQNELERMKKLLAECPTDLRGWEWDHLSSFYDQSTLTLHGHTDTIRSLAFSLDGKLIVSCGDYNEINVWDAATGGNILTLQGQEQSIAFVAFSPDGKRIASGYGHDKIKIWDALTGKILTELRGHKGWVTSVAFSMDGHRIVSGGSDDTIKIWDAVSGERLETFRAFGDGITSVALSPDDKRIISVSEDKTVMLWDVTTGDNTPILIRQRGVVRSVAFRPDGKWIVLGESRGKVWWMTSTDRYAQMPREENSAISSAAMSKDGMRIVSAGMDKMIKVWDTTTGREMVTLRGHEHRVTSLAVSADGSQITSGDTEGTIKVWEDTKIDGVLTLEGHEKRVTAVAFSPDGKRIVSGSQDHTIKVWDAATGQEFKTLYGHIGGVSSVAWSPDGTRIVSGSGEMAGSDCDCDGPPILSPLPDGLTCIKVWDATTGENLKTLRGHDRPVHSVAFSPDGERIVSGSWNESIKVWGAGTGENSLSLRGHNFHIVSVAFSPDGTRIISGGSGDDTVNVWDAATGENTLTLRGHEGGVRSVAFSQDGTRIVSGSGDHTVKIWDAATGENTLTLHGHEGGVRSVVFSLDGTRIVSASADKTIKIWDATTGSNLLTLRGYTDAVTSVGFSPDGRRIVSGGEDGAIKVWETSIPSHAILMKRRAVAERCRRAEALKKESAEVQEDAAEAKNEATSQPGEDVEESPPRHRGGATQPTTQPSTSQPVDAEAGQSTRSKPSSPSHP